MEVVRGISLEVVKVMPQERISKSRLVRVPQECVSESFDGQVKSSGVRVPLEESCEVFISWSHSTTC